MHVCVHVLVCVIKYTINILTFIEKWKKSDLRSVLDI